MKTPHAALRLAPGNPHHAALLASPTLHNQVANDAALREPQLNGNQCSIPKQVALERSLEENYMRRAPPDPHEEIIRSTRIYFDQDDDFVIEFENHKNAYALVVLLRNRKRLKWRECRAICDCVKIGRRGASISNPTFSQRCAILRDNYGAQETSGPMLENDRLVFLLDPSERPLKLTGSDFVEYLHIHFDADGDLVLEATNHALSAFRVVLALQPSADAFPFPVGTLTIADCNAMIEVLAMLEPGGRIDLTEFLCHLSELREHYNFLSLGRDDGVVGCLIHASAERSEETQVPQPIQSALEEQRKKVAEAEAKAAANAAAAAAISISALNPLSLAAHNANPVYGDQAAVPPAHVQYGAAAHGVAVAGGIGAMPPLHPILPLPPMPAPVSPVSPLPHCPYPDMVYTRALQESGQAQVYAGEKRSTGEKVAIKVFSGTGNSAGSTFRIELRMLLKMPEHRNVISVLDFFEYPRPALVTRLIEGGGDMLQHLRKHGQMAPGMVRQIAAELADGVLHLHHSGIVHRDLKSANVLLRATPPSHNLTPVIIDLGLGGALRRRGEKRGSGGAMKIDELVATFAQTRISEKTGSMKGTPFWMAPEMIARQEWSEKTDVFAFGIILWEMLSGSVPYSNLRLVHQWDLLTRIMAGARPDLAAIEGAPVELQQLVKQCWLQEPRDRPTMLQVLDKLRGSDPEAIFHSVDTNGDRALNFMELVGFLNRYAPDTAPEEMYPIFNSLDLNNSGAISLEEFLRFWGRVEHVGLGAALKECQRVGKRPAQSVAQTK